MEPPALVSGSVESFRVFSWDAPATFVLLITTDLHFEGDAKAWNRGMNTRFVTAQCDGPDGGYLLESATSP